jgi:acyl-CoA synthetase (NDP forming)
MTTLQPCDLSGLFDPRSIAVIGASASPGKWGHEYSRQLLAGRHRRRVWLVNERRAPVLGEPTFASLNDLPDVPEKALICLPRDAVETAVEAALRRGVRHLVVVAAGFGETGAEGAALQARIVARVRASGARLVGPNCLGLFDAAAEFACMSFWEVPPGRIGIVSQSGTVLLEIAERLRRTGRGVSRAASLGNQADIGVEDYVRSFTSLPDTDALVVYAESFRDGRAVLAACAAVQASGIPVVLLAPPASEAVARSISSHTGSLVAPDRVLAAALADAGLRRAAGMSDLMRQRAGLDAPTRPRAWRVAVLVDGGGCATLATAAATAEGFDVVAFSPSLVDRLRALAAPGCGLSNPVDVVGALDFGIFLPLAEEIATSGEVDALLFSGFFNNLTGASAAEEVAVGARFVNLALQTGTGLAVASLYPREPALAAIAAAGMPVTDFPEDAARALRMALAPPPPQGLAPLPPARPAQPADGYFDARATFAAEGVAFPSARCTATRDETLAAAAEIGYPVALKALAGLHKSDGGGVRLNLRDAQALAAAFDAMAPLAAPAYSVEAMVNLSGGVEVLIGTLMDASFGPIIAVGAGGTLTEVLEDTVVALSPVSEEKALAMLRHLRMAPLFDGFRGGPALDLRALASTVAAVSRVSAARPDILEAELNPVFALPGGCIAVDARIVSGQSMSPTLARGDGGQVSGPPP